MLKINGTAAPSPGALQVTIEDISGAAERSAAGGVVRDFMGSRRRLKLRWPCLSAAQLSALLRAVDNRFFQATYPDPAQGGEATVECYCAARSMGALRVRNGEALWTDIEMEWMER